MGNPTAFHLTGGQEHDVLGADALLEGIEAQALLADKAYDAEDRVLNKLKQKKCEAVSPPKYKPILPSPEYRSFVRTTETVIEILHFVALSSYAKSFGVTSAPLALG